MIHYRSELPSFSTVLSNISPTQIKCFASSASLKRLKRATKDWYDDKYSSRHAKGRARIGTCIRDRARTTAKGKARARIRLRDSMETAIRVGSTIKLQQKTTH